MSNRNVLTAVFAVVLAALGAAQAFAQSGVALRADIGFEFAAGPVKYPAGEYTIRPDGGMSQWLLSLRGEQGGAAALLMVNPSYSVIPSDQSKLVFHKYGDQYFLSEIWVEGMSRGWWLPPSASERELSRRAARQDLVTVLAKR